MERNPMNKKNYRIALTTLEKKSDLYIFYFVQSKHKVPDNWNQESPDIGKREASHGCWTAKAQMKGPQKRKLSMLVEKDAT